MELIYLKFRRVQRIPKIYWRVFCNLTADTSNWIPCNAFFVFLFLFFPSFCAHFKTNLNNNLNKARKDSRNESTCESESDIWMQVAKEKTHVREIREVKVWPIWMGLRPTDKISLFFIMKITLTVNWKLCNSRFFISPLNLPYFFAYAAYCHTRTRIFNSTFWG